MISSTKRLHIVLFALFATTIQALAQDVKLRIDAPDKIVLGEKIEINYIIESNKPIEENITIKNIDQIEILYGPTISHSSFITNDGKKSTFLKTYSFIGIAKKAGRITIPKFQVKIAENNHQSESKIIKVEDNPSNSFSDRSNSNNEKSLKRRKEQQNKIEKIVKDAKIDTFIKSIPSKERVNPSDTLSVTYRLYTTSEDFKIIDVNLPSSRSFYSNNYRPQNEQGKQVTIKGTKYYIFDVYKTILQPRTIGTSTMNDGQITLLYYIKTGVKTTNDWGEESEVVRKKEIELKIDGITVSVFELVEV